MTHPREAANRAVKVTGLVRALSEYTRHSGEVVTADELLSWTKSQWETLAKIGMVNPPGSRETVETVVQAVRARETAWDAPLTKFCDKRPAMLTAFRASGKWHVRIEGVTGVAVDFAEAAANCMNALFVAQHDDGPVSETRTA